MRTQAGVALIALLSTVPISAAAAKCGHASVPVAVIDQGGASLAGLSPSDFKVWMKNQSASVVADDYGVFPHATLILLSRNANMGQSLKMDLGRRYVQEIVSTAPGSVMLGSFAGDVSGLEDGRSGQGATLSAQPGGDTRNEIFDAIAAGMMTMHPHRGDAIVIITDSPDDGSKAVAGDIAQRLAASGARLFIVTLPPATSSGNMQSLLQLAEGSGGTVIVPLRLDATTKGVEITSAQMDGAITNLSRSFAQFNSLYQLDTNIDTPDRPVPLRVEVDRRKLGGGKVFAPAWVAPCSALPQ